jgi:hypothetical protein
MARNPDHGDADPDPPLSQASAGDSDSPPAPHPWILTLDNIFVDVARNFPDNQFLLENNIEPGTQNTALTDDMKQFALKVIQMKDDSEEDNYGSTELSSTLGGCGLNTARAANEYLKAVGDIMDRKKARKPGANAGV